MKGITNMNDAKTREQQLREQDIVCVGWDGLSQPIYRFRSELHLPEWQQKRVYPPVNLTPVS